MTLAPDDVPMAGRGDLSALRRMRDHWLELAVGTIEAPHLPRHEALAQMELLAELAVGSAEPEDRVFLIVAYQVRVAQLQRNLDAALECLGRAIGSDSAVVDHWSRETAACEDRLRAYLAKRDRLVEATLADAEAAALMVNLYTAQADAGDEHAAVVLQTIMDSLTPEQAQATQAHVRKMEEEAAR